MGGVRRPTLDKSVQAAAPCQQGITALVMWMGIAVMDVAEIFLDVQNLAFRTQLICQFTKPHLAILNFDNVNDDCCD